MSSTKFFEIIKSDSIEFQLKDLLEFEEIIVGLYDAGKANIELEIQHEAKYIKASSVSDLLREKLPITTNRLVISARHLDTFTPSLKITFYSNYIQYEIYSEEEGWFLKSKKSIQSFLEAKKPWHWWTKKKWFYELRGALWVLGSIMSGVLIYYSYKHNNPWFGISGSLVLLLVLYVIPKIFSERHLPYTRIYLEKNPSSDYRTTTLIISVITLIVLIIGTILIPLIISR